ncbi:MAG: Unknown protein [uncultured Sulfurovum sp.]|uniref:Uncharacterized protein n=1 Tax=uncultured Sulfurovum sp. TaxID=269237 RepID=A0A6S6TJ35_9BACT|nr:MAG: Unknown protein [uncultured Sulfurovum sp.]
MQVTIDIRESAYDKIIYFLKHLKDDVVILSPTKVEETDVNENSASFFDTLRARKLQVAKDVSIEKIMNEMNDGLS